MDIRPTYSSSSSCYHRGLEERVKTGRYQVVGAPSVFDDYPSSLAFFLLVWISLFNSRLDTTISERFIAGF
jgi:hypothetical protein